MVIGVFALAAAVAGAVVAAMLVLVIGAAAGTTNASAEAGGSAPNGSELAAFAAPAAAPPSPDALVVDVAGGVLEPGIRTLRVGDRVGDAIAAAGGFAPRADLSETSRAVNLAQPLTDGMKILVPELGTASRSGTGSPSDAGDGLIDLNSAGQAELETLPGIGPVTAQKIVQERAEQPFGSVQDLRDRGVVGQSVFEQIRDMVRTEGG